MHTQQPVPITAHVQCPPINLINFPVTDTPPRASERRPQPSGDPATLNLQNILYTSPVIPNTRPSLRVSPSPRISPNLNSQCILAPIGASYPNPLQILPNSLENRKFSDFNTCLQTQSASLPNPPIATHEPNTLPTTRNINSPPKEKSVKFPDGHFINIPANMPVLDPETVKFLYNLSCSKGLLTRPALENPPPPAGNLFPASCPRIPLSAPENTLFTPNCPLTHPIVPPRPNF